MERSFTAPNPRFALRFLEFLRRQEWMPEAWIYGTAHVLRQTQDRAAFLNGEVRAGGWWWYFPYTFVVKTPLLFFAIVVLAGVAAVAGRDGRTIRSAAYACAPLWILVVGYSAVVMSSTMNIGHRHLLPVYPAMFVLCVAAGRWLTGRRAGVVLVAIVGLLAGEMLCVIRTTSRISMAW